MTPPPPSGAPLRGWHVLVPRPAGHAGDLIDAVRAAGGMPIHVPLIATVPQADSPDLRAAVADLAAGTFDWLAVTSAAAVDALRAAAHAAARPLTISPSTKVAAVGAGSASALRRAGLDVHLVAPPPGSARSLAAAWPAGPAGMRVLAPLSDRSRTTLVDALRAAGHAVTAVVAYRTVTLRIPEPTRRQLAAGEIDAVLVTSPSIADAVAAATPAQKVRLIAIGAPSAHSITAAGLKTAAVATTPSPAGLVAALIRAAAVGADAGGVAPWNPATPYRPPADT